MDLWVIWLVAAFLFGLGEIHARGLVLAPLAVGALAATGAALAGVGATLSVLIFLALSLVVLRALRPLALHQQRLPMALRTGPAALVGPRAGCRTHRQRRGRRQRHDRRRAVDRARP